MSSTAETQAAALERARSGQSFANFPAIIRGFLEKGIPEDQILPRENVFTFQAWHALGRTVRKGEHGIKVLTWIEMSSERTDPDTGEVTRAAFRRPRTTTVFHVSQTVPLNGREAP